MRGPLAHVAFWSAALGYKVSSEGTRWAYLVDPKRRKPGLFLQEVPDPTPGKNRWHLDLYARDEEAEVTRLLTLGATRVKRYKKDEGDIVGTVLVVMRDVEGNYFCVVRA